MPPPEGCDPTWFRQATSKECDVWVLPQAVQVFGANMRWTIKSESSHKDHTGDLTSALKAAEAAANIIRANVMHFALLHTP